jgi:ankyrin repeat protein
MNPTKPSGPPPPPAVDSPRRGENLVSPDTAFNLNGNGPKAQEKRLGVIPFLPLQHRQERISKEVRALCTVEEAENMNAQYYDAIEKIKELQQEKVNLFASTRQYDTDGKQKFYELKIDLKRNEKELRQLVNQQWHLRKSYEDKLETDLKQTEKALADTAKADGDVDIDQIKSFHAAIRSIRLQLRSGVFGTEGEDHKDLEKMDQNERKLGALRKSIDAMKREVRLFDLHHSNVNKKEEKMLLEVERIEVKIKGKQSLMQDIDTRADIVMRLIGLCTQLVAECNKEMGALALEIKCDYEKLEELDQWKKSIKAKEDELRVRPEVKRKEEEKFRVKEEEKRFQKKYPGPQGLIAAAQAGDTDGVRVFVQSYGHGTALEAAVNIVDANGSSPLSHAVENGHVGIVSVLCKHKAEINLANKGGWEPIHIAAKNGYGDIIALLVEYEANVNAPNKLNRMTPLHHATAAVRVQAMRVLVKLGANFAAIDKNGRSSMEIAIRNGSTECIEILQRAGKIEATKAKYPGKLGLISAVQQGDVEEVEVLLLAKGIDVNSTDDDGRSPLHKACDKGLKDICAILCNNKAMVNARERWDGNTPLHFAAMNGWADIVKMLIDHHKADIDAVNDSGWNALHFASENGHCEIIVVLIQRKANVRMVNDNGYTPLHKAAQFGHADIVKVLCEKSPEITDVKLKDEGTAMHLAAKKGYGRVVKVLLDNKADRSIMNFMRQTPLDLASRYEHTRCVYVLTHTKII